MGLIERKAMRVSVTVNAVLFVMLGSVSLGGCLSTPKEEIIPMEFLVVTEENAADRLAEEPNEASEQEPESEPPKPDPIPEPDPPPPPPPVKDPDPISPPPPKRPEPPKPKPSKDEKKPKPEEPKPKERKPAPPKPKPKWQPTPVKISKVRVGPVTSGKKDVAKAATQKALSEAEIRKLLGAGAKSGNRNQTPPNDASRCYGVIAKAFREKCNAYGLEASPTGGDPVLTVSFGVGGSIRDIVVKTSSGDRGYDGHVLQACRQVRRIEGLSVTFLAEYKTIDIRLSVE